MNFSQLHYIKAVCETRSFSRAAEMCFVTQPTLSNSIAQLEGELGGRLFIRTTRKVELTEFGEFLLPLVENVMLAQSNLQHQAKAFQNIEQSMIRIGLSPLINTDLLAKVLEPFNNNYPNISFILTELNLSDLFDQLKIQRLDFVFAPTSLLYLEHKRLSFYEEELLFIEKPTSKKNRFKSIRLEDIVDETFVMVPNECGLANKTRELFTTQHLSFNEYSGKALSYQVLENWAKLGVGVAILPKSKVSLDNHSAKILVDNLGNPLTISYEMRWNSKYINNENLKQFIKHFKTIVPTIIDGIHLV